VLTPWRRPGARKIRVPHRAIDRGILVYTSAFGFLQDQYQKSKNYFLGNQKAKIENPLSFSRLQQRNHARIH
jgi:hypothetical protein